MPDENLIERIAAGLAARFAASDDLVVDAVEAYLNEAMADLDRQSRFDVLQKMVDGWADTCRPCLPVEDRDEVLTRVCSLLLGRKVTADDLSSGELLEKLAESLNTIFNTLNQLIGAINMTFTGEGSPEQTIRQVIGFRLEGAGQGGSLETYLGQIGQAFLTSQQAFKEAAYAKIRQVLSVLNPEKLADETEKRLRFGPLKKAEMFDIYAHRYEKIHQWFHSGRFMEDFLREFEKNCQTHFGKSPAHPGG